MQEKGFVSIVLTTCNRKPETVKRAIISIISQTFHNWELIIVDDSPQEFGLRTEVKEMVFSIVPSSVLTYLQNSTNKGACYSRNIGLNHARGEYIAFIDDDDEWLAEKLEKQVKALQSSDTNVALVYGPYYIVHRDSKRKDLKQLKDISGISIRDLLFQGNSIGGVSMPLLKTRCILDVGGFDELLQSSQDSDLWLRILNRYKTKYIDEPLAIYYEHDGERISSNPIKKIHGMERINEKYAQYLKTDRRLWWKRHIIILCYYAMNHEGKKALLIWLKCVCKYPEKIVENSISLIRIIKIIGISYLSR